MSRSRFIFDPRSFSFTKASIGVVKGVRLVLGRVLFLLTFLVVTYLLFALVFSTDTERRLRKEIRMYEKLYPELAARGELLGDAVASIQHKDNAIYEQIFHSSAPDADPMESLYRISGRDTIPEDQLVIYTLDKADRLLGQAASVDSAYARIFMALGREDLIIPPMTLPLEDVSYPQVGASTGSKLNPFYNAYVTHTGLDLIATRGTPVLATADGVVTEVFYSKPTGNTVKISHSGGYVTVYSHLESMLPFVGQSVRTGQKIGTVGMSGTSFAPHLHYEVLRDGVTQDPVNYIFASVAPLEYANMLFVSATTNQSMD